MATKNSVSNDFLSTFVNSINVFDCRLSSVSDGLLGSYFHLHSNVNRTVCKLTVETLIARVLVIVYDSMLIWVKVHKYVHDGSARAPSPRHTNMNMII